MANCVDQDHMVHFRSYVIWVRALYSRVNMHSLCRWSNQCFVESSKLRPKLLVWMADCVDPDRIVYFRRYAIWVCPYCLRVQMDMPRTWSNQRLIESSQTASKTTGWMANCVDPDQIVYVRSYVFRIRFVCSCVNMYIPRTWSNLRLVESNNPNICRLAPVLNAYKHGREIHVCRLHDILAV